MFNNGVVLTDLVFVFKALKHWTEQFLSCIPETAKCITRFSVFLMLIVFSCLCVTSSFISSLKVNGTVRRRTNLFGRTSANLSTNPLYDRRPKVCAALLYTLGSPNICCFVFSFLLIGLYHNQEKILATWPARSPWAMRSGSSWWWWWKRRWSP